MLRASTEERRSLARLLRVLRARAARRPRRVLLEEAEIELWGLYRREQAELLREASELRLALDVAASLDALDLWREHAVDCAAACAADGYPFAPRLAACVANPLHAWPSLGTLAADARALGARC